MQTDIKYCQKKITVVTSLTQNITDMLWTGWESQKESKQTMDYTGNDQ
jgi:hypothetical protein